MARRQHEHTLQTIGTDIAAAGSRHGAATIGRSACCHDRLDRLDRLPKPLADHGHVGSLPPIGRRLRRLPCLGMLGVPVWCEGGHLDCNGRCGRRCVCHRRLPSRRPRRRRPRGGNLLWRSGGRLRDSCSAWSGLCRLSGLEQHSAPRPQGRPHHDRRGTGRGYDDGLCSRRRNDDHATAGEPPRWHGKSLVRRRDTHGYHHQHHDPQACRSSHGITPFLHVAKNRPRTRTAPRPVSIRLRERSRQHRPS